MLVSFNHGSSVIDPSDLEDPVTVDPGSSTLFFTSQVTYWTMENIFADFGLNMFDTNCESINMEDGLLDLEGLFKLMEDTGIESENVSDTTWASQDKNLETLIQETLGDLFLSENTDEKVESPKAPVMSLAGVSFSDVSLSDDNDENPEVPAPQTPPPPSRPSSCPTPPPFQPAELSTNHVQSRSNNVPVVQSSEEFPHSLHPVGYLNGEAVYELPHGYAHNISAAVPIQQQHQEKRYVKKPPNAFMLYRQEQRHNVVSQYNITDSAAVNKILGAKWKSLSMEQQTKYYEQAEMEKLFHAQQHPEWSAKENYLKLNQQQAQSEPRSLVGHLLT
ncbi:hypothetical protein PAMP_023025 [Pampus punctatissimus]